MNITLIYPLLSRRRAAVDENKQFWPPLGLAYIAAVLEQNGHEVEILDRDVILRKNDLDFEKADKVTLEKIAAFKSGIVGISVTTPNMPDVTHLSSLIRNSFKDIMIVAGGPHVSGEPILTLKEAPSCDVAVRGEGEFTLLDIASGTKLDSISGIFYRQNGDIISNAPRVPIADLDSLPMPARHLLDMKFYIRPSRFTSRNLSLRTTSIFTARGCPYRCNFCAGPLVFSGKVRFHSPDRVIKEIEGLIADYGVEALYFAEDMFLSSQKRAEDILGLFIDKGINKKIKWIAQAKASIITSELLDLMKDAGCVGVEYGFESGSQRVLDLMNKKLKVEDSLRAAALTRKAHLRFQANIIVGYPGEREPDFKSTIYFIKKIRPNMASLNLFMPLPGTASYEKLKQSGIVMPRWEDVGDQESPQVNFADMPKGVFEKLYYKARLKVILPLNLYNFIVDNINNPARLFKVGFTQFGGVIGKTFRMLLKIFLADKSAAKTRVLYLSYNGLLEPIVPSQVVPYLAGLAGKGYEFILVTYEKKRDLKNTGRAALKSKKENLMSLGIDWRYLRYHKNPAHVSTIFDILNGTLHCLFLIVVKRVKIVHVRGITPGLIMIALSKILRVKILFDMRGLLAEEYAAGGLWKEGGSSYRLVKAAEKHMLMIADGVTVLTKRHLEFNKELECMKNRKIPMEVIPCCVDMEKFRHDLQSGFSIKKKFGIENKFVLMYPGKIGTFYLMDRMLSFYKTISETVKDAVFFIISHDDIVAELDKMPDAGIDRKRIISVNGASFEDMPAYLNAATAGIFLINPYKKFGSSPIKMGEFLAAGIPVIINPGIGDTEELVRDNGVGVIVEGFGTEFYKDAVKKLLVLLQDGDALKDRCRRIAKEYFSLEDGVSKYYDIYKELTVK